MREVAVETAKIKSIGSSIIPVIDFSQILDDTAKCIVPEFDFRGIIIIRNVIPREEVKEWAKQLRQTGVQFLQSLEQQALGHASTTFWKIPEFIYPLYFTKQQIMARQH